MYIKVDKMTEKEKLLAFLAALTPAEFGYLASRIEDIKKAFEESKPKGGR